MWSLGCDFRQHSCASWIWMNWMGQKNNQYCRFSLFMRLDCFLEPHYLTKWSKAETKDALTVLNIFLYFTFTDLTVYSKFLIFLTVNTFTRARLSETTNSPVCQIYTRESRRRKHFSYWLQHGHTSTTNRQGGGWYRNIWNKLFFYFLWWHNHC